MQLKKLFDIKLPKIWTSTCLGFSMNFSINTAPLPNADVASETALLKSSSNSYQVSIEGKNITKIT